VSVSERHSVRYGRTRIDMTVVRSPRRRTVTISVDPFEGVRVLAPDDASLDTLDTLIGRKAPWILSKLRVEGQSEPTPIREYITGESYLYLGRHYRLRVLFSEAGGSTVVALRRGFLEVALDTSVPSPARPDAVRQALQGWYRHRAAVRLPERVALYAERLGMTPPRLLIRHQTKRWGSCDAQGNLRLNWRIVMAPVLLVDYVVAHELCHLVHHDHSAAFWQLLGTIMPNYEVARDRLRREGAQFVV